MVRRKASPAVFFCFNFFFLNKTFLVGIVCVDYGDRCEKKIGGSPIRPRVQRPLAMNGMWGRGGLSICFLSICSIRYRFPSCSNFHRRIGLASFFVGYFLFCFENAESWNPVRPVDFGDSSLVDWPGRSRRPFFFCFVPHLVANSTFPVLLIAI